MKQKVRGIQLVTLSEGLSQVMAKSILSITYYDLRRPLQIADPNSSIWQTS